MKIESFIKRIVLLYEEFQIVIMYLLKNDDTNGNYLYIQISCMHIQMKLLIFSQNKNISEKMAKSNRK